MMQKRVPDLLEGRRWCRNVCWIYWRVVDGAETCAGFTGGSWMVQKRVPDLLEGRTWCRNVCRIYWGAVDGAETCAGFSGGL